MKTFIDFAVDYLIKNAEDFGMKSGMVRAFREETDVQLSMRVLSVITEIGAIYVATNGPLMIQNTVRDAAEIVLKLKEKLKEKESIHFSA